MPVSLVSLSNHKARSNLETLQVPMTLKREYAQVTQRSKYEENYSRSTNLNRIH